MKTKTLLFILTVLIVASCKKGEEDRFISLRSRKARVTGEWHIESGKSTYELANSSGQIADSYGFTFTKSGYNYSEGYGASAGYYVGSHSLSMMFEKSGAVSVLENFDGTLYEHHGKWNFNGGVGEAKSKDQIIIHYDTYITHSGTKTYGGNQVDITYSIVKLTNKSMKLKSEYVQTDIGGNKTTYRDSYEMEQ